jgi:hypothetical protein
MNYGRPWVSPNTNAGSWQALGLPTSAKVAKLLTILPNAAELYRRQIALGLDGAHPQITLKVRLALRELLGQIKPRARRRWQPVGGLLGAAVGVGAGCRIRVCRLRDSNPRPPDYKMGEWGSSKRGRNQRIVFTEVFFRQKMNSAWHPLHLSRLSTTKWDRLPQNPHKDLIVSRSRDADWTVPLPTHFFVLAAATGSGSIQGLNTAARAFTKSLVSRVTTVKP